MHKTGLNAKPDCGLHDFTLSTLYYNQYHRSREWFIRSAGAYNEGWRKDGRTGYETETEWKQGYYDMKSRFSRWVMPEQKSGIWRKEVNSWLISRSDKQLALPHQITAPSRAHLHHHHTVKFALTNPSWAHNTGLSLATFHPEHHQNQRLQDKIKF